MPLKYPDIFEPNNQSNAQIDSDFVRGGGRVTANLSTLLTDFATKTDQLKDNVTLVWVISAGQFYRLKSKANIGNLSNGWEPLGANITVDSTPASGSSNPIASNWAYSAEQSLNAKLGGTLASDAETQITSAPGAEDNKFVSRLKLFNWWVWVKGQAQSISGSWTFTANALFGAKTTAGTTTPNNAHHTIGASTSSTAQQRLVPGAVYTGSEDGAEWYESNGTTQTRPRMYTGNIVNDYLLAYNNYLLRGGTANYMLEKNQYGDISAVNEIVEQFVYDSDVINAITGASYNSGNNFTASLSPANSKVMKAGQIYKTGSTIFLAVGDNLCYKNTSLAETQSLDARLTTVEQSMSGFKVMFPLSQSSN